MEPAIVRHLQAALGAHASAADQQLLRETSSRDRYRRYLQRALGFERGLVSMLGNITFDWDVEARAKLPLIAADLLALGESVAAIVTLPTCHVFDEVRDGAEALAWLFVVDRASNAVLMAYHQLDHVVREMAASYLGARVRREGWPDLMQAFSRISDESAVIESLVESSRRAFAAHHDWFAEGDANTSETLAPSEFVANVDLARDVES